MNSTYLWEPFSEDNIRDPYQMYKKLRETDPIHTAQTREVIITSYEAIKDILKNPTFHTGNRMEWLTRSISYLQKKDEDLTAIYEAINSFILMLNPPQHTKIRTFVAKTWNNRDVDEMIQNNVSKTLGAIPEAFDVVNDFAQPLSTFTICSILGVDANDYNYLTNLGAAMTKAVDLYPSLREMVQMNDAAKAFVVFFREHINSKKSLDDKGLLSRLICKNNDEHIGLTDRELISIAIFLFIAGQETSSGLISNGIYNLLLHPNQLRKLDTDPALLESTVEEALRFDSPVQLLGRVSSAEYHVMGKVIPKGAAVTLVIGSANRDGDVFTNPDVFDVERSPNRHLSFGSGIHFCMGDWLARRQAQIAFRNFFGRFRNIEGDLKNIRWNKNLAIRSLQQLKVKVRE
jgi:cytochrome P450